MLTIQPHRWEDASGKHGAVCFPFVNGVPCHEISSCGYCTFYREGADYCDGWKDEPENSPLFCGPICERFSPTDETKTMITGIFKEATNGV